MLFYSQRLVWICVFLLPQLKFYNNELVFLMCLLMHKHSHPYRVNFKALLRPTKRFQCNKLRRKCEIMILCKYQIWIYLICSCVCAFHCFWCKSCGLCVNVFLSFCPLWHYLLLSSSGVHLWHIQVKGEKIGDLRSCLCQISFTWALRSTLTSGAELLSAGLPPAGQPLLWLVFPFRLNHCQDDVTNLIKLIFWRP